MSFTKVGAFFQDKVIHIEIKFLMILYRKCIILIKKFVVQHCPVRNATTFVSDMIKISWIMRYRCFTEIHQFSRQKLTPDAEIYNFSNSYKINQSINCSKNNIGEQ